MELEIKKYPDPILKRKNRKIETFDEKIANLCRDMIETMAITKGAGLAAPQIGENFCLFVANLGQGPQAFINPEVIKKSGKEILEEGCLSFPGVFLKIKRAKKIEIICQDIKGDVRRFKAEGLPARIIQHETDHLNGILFIDRLPWYKKVSLKNKLKKRD